MADRSAQGAIGAAVAEAVDAGIPEAVAIFGKFTLAEGTGAASNGALGKGKGLRHLSQSPLAATIE